jgi:hypothetical protein
LYINTVNFWPSNKQISEFILSTFVLYNLKIIALKKINW